jgi:hypothetical protein
MDYMIKLRLLSVNIDHIVLLDQDFSLCSQRRCMKAVAEPYGRHLCLHGERGSCYC